MGLFLEWCIEQAQWPQWGAGVGGGSAFRRSPVGAWWNASRCVIEVRSLRPVRSPVPPPAQADCSSLSVSAFCPAALCTSSDGASTASLGKPVRTRIERVPKKVALICSPRFPSCNYIPSLSALPLRVTLSNSFPSSVCLHPCSGRVFDPRSFLSSLSFAYSWLVLRENPYK